MNAHRNAATAGEHEAEKRGARGMRAENAVHLLSIGSIDRSYMLHDLLLLDSRCRLSVMTDYRDLWTISEVDAVHLAVLQDTLRPLELDKACRFIRHRWPHAKILVIRSGEDFLEDALYDDRVKPTESMEGLLNRIARILGGLS